MKYPKGTWEVADCREDMVEQLSIVSDKGIVARIRNEVRKQPLTAEDEANANLIAAAPDMLAMLEELEWSGAYHENPDYCPICAAAKDGFHGHDTDCKLGNLLAKIRGNDDGNRRHG